MSTEEDSQSLSRKRRHNDTDESSMESNDTLDSIESDFPVPHPIKEEILVKSEPQQVHVKSEPQVSEPIAASNISWYNDDDEEEERRERRKRPVDARKASSISYSDSEEEEPDETNTISSQQNAPTEGETGHFGMSRGYFAATAKPESDSSSKMYADSISDYSRRIMSKMGFVEGKGLGQGDKGIAQAVDADTDRMVSQSGLGYVTQIKVKSHQYTEFVASPEIDVTFLSPLANAHMPRADQEDFTANSNTPSVNSWVGMGPRTFEYRDESFCPIITQQALFDAKSVFDNVPDMAFLTARDRSNPFEKLKKEIFQNRAALKMAEMDAACGNIFTNPAVLQEENKKGRTSMYFGDVCAGPGGFTEFMLTVKKWRAKGFGFTLKASNDFKVEKFNKCAPHQTFKAYYGDGSGDITRTKNIEAFAQNVKEETNGHGLHVMLADGGFSVAGKENYQELLSRQLVLCQFATAISTLCKGGVFVCKLFDTFLRFTVDCMYLMRLAFDHVAIIKPNQSRPANSERYIVCKGLKMQGSTKHPIAAFMLKVNDKMNEIDPLDSQIDALNAAKDEGKSKTIMFVKGESIRGQSDTVATTTSQLKTGDAVVFDIPKPKVGQTIVSLVPSNFMDAEFKNYVTSFNSKYAEIQTKWLERVKQYMEDHNLKSDDQDDVRMKCAKLWKVPTTTDRASLPPEYIHFDPAWGNKLCSDDVNQQKPFGGSSLSEMNYKNHLIRLNNNQSRNKIITMTRVYMEATKANPTPTPQDMCKVMLTMVSDVIPDKPRSADWLAIPMAEGTRRCVVVQPNERSKSTVVSLFSDKDESSTVSKVETTVRPLSTPFLADTILEGFCITMPNQQTYFEFFDAWRLPYPSHDGMDENMFDKRLKYSDRVQLLRIYFENLRLNMVNTKEKQYWPYPTIRRSSARQVDEFVKYAGQCWNLINLHIFEQRKTKSDARSVTFFVKKSDKPEMVKLQRDSIILFMQNKFQFQ